MTDIKSTLDNMEDKAQEKKGEIKERLQQVEKDNEQHSANEE
ncbi:MAG TPA: hypothetical protein VJ836_04700 [Candidatus Saccharimonadales bacterium]|nr:hypothetical protein [Candidatus Saccharimonadales bacterium]